MGTLTLQDPRQMDGEPHEVAHAAGLQLERALEATQWALEGFRWAARGAWLSAEDHRTGHMPTGMDYDAGPQGKKLREAYDSLAKLHHEQTILTTAAGWNPKDV